MVSLFEQYAESRGVVNYRESVRFLYSLGNEIQTAKLGLDRITRILAALGSPHLKGRFVHVAGTNGKGSTSAMIESGLRSAGKRTGLYTSPHLGEPVERIRIMGEPAGEDQFAAAFNLVHEAAADLQRTGQIDLHPTYFETVTAMAFVLFRDAGLDWVVLEVGMGGRLDATNVVRPELCVITQIDLDHQVFLGDTIEKIAAEKAGILKPGVPAVFSHQRSELAAEVLRERAGGQYTFTDEWPVHELSLDARGSRFWIRNLEVFCPLAGEHQVENARTAAIALNQLGCPVEGISQTKWPGRLELIRQKPEIILDGAHNIAGTQALVRYIQRFYAGRNIWIIYGVMRDKAVDEMAAMLFPLASRVVLTTPANSRAMPPEHIPAPEGSLVTHSVAEALELVEEAAPDDVVFVTGSLFVVGEARALA
jgi:dihydrofolate synthase/folylpolyglutamate synthase